jgi:hypothetical protein
VDAGAGSVGFIIGLVDMFKENGRDYPSLNEYRSTSSQQLGVGPPRGLELIGDVL